MSEENVENVRRGFAAYREGGIEALLDFNTEDVVIHSIPEWPDDAEYHGLDGVRRLSDEWTSNFDDFVFELHDVRDAGEAVVALCQLTGRIKRSGTPLELPIGAVFSDFRDGLIGQVRYFADWPGALEAGGLEGAESSPSG